MAIKRYTNETDILQIVYDHWMRPYRVLPGESVEFEMGEPYTPPLSKFEPPVGMQGIKNLYRNPKTGRMEVEFIDALKE